MKKLFFINNDQKIHVIILVNNNFTFIFNVEPFLTLFSLSLTLKVKMHTQHTHSHTHINILYTTYTLSLIIHAHTLSNSS